MSLLGVREEGYRDRTRGSDCAKHHSGFSLPSSPLELIDALWAMRVQEQTSGLVIGIVI